MVSAGMAATMPLRARATPIKAMVMRLGCFLEGVILEIEFKSSPASWLKVLSSGLLRLGIKE